VCVSLGHRGVGLLGRETLFVYFQNSSPSVFLLHSGKMFFFPQHLPRERAASTGEGTSSPSAPSLALGELFFIFLFLPHFL
jgi:hypothetical protein